MDETPRYMISVAAALVGMHPQTLRIYEQKGLVRPKRTAGLLVHCIYSVQFPMVTRPPASSIASSANFAFAT